MRWEVACTDFGLDALCEQGPSISAIATWHMPEAYQTQQYPEFELFEEEDLLGFKVFLESVLARVSGNVVMVLDNSRVHRNADVVKFVEENERLEIVFLPAYAPELNPIELLWAWVKGHWLANLVVLSVEELRGLWRDAVDPLVVRPLPQPKARPALLPIQP